MQTIQGQSVETENYFLIMQNTVYELIGKAW